ncbi:hypothetical protein GCM10028777_24880 [Angustibacter speluncae]
MLVGVSDITGAGVVVADLDAVLPAVATDVDSHAALSSVQDISPHTAPDLRVHTAQTHSAQWLLVRDYLD